MIRGNTRGAVAVIFSINMDVLVAKVMILGSNKKRLGYSSDSTAVMEFTLLSMKLEPAMSADLVLHNKVEACGPESGETPH